MKRLIRKIKERETGRTEDARNTDRSANQTPYVSEEHGKRPGKDNTAAYSHFVKDMATEPE